MHIWGKIFLGVIAVLALVALILTSMLYDAQGAWQQRVEKAQATRDDLTEQLRVKELSVRGKEAEVNRMMMPWGRAWELRADEIELRDPNQGIVLLGIGTSAGLAAREASQGKQLPTVYLFGKNQDGTSNYLGAFRITEVEPARALAQLIRPPYPGETAAWKAEAGVRVWEGIPSHWRALHADLQARNSIAWQEVIDHEARLKLQEKLVAESKKQLGERMQQLQGDPDPVPGAGQDAIDGLVVALKKEETVRNQQLAELDRLRHEFNEKYNQLMELLERNRALESQLPASDSGGANGRTADAVRPAEQRR